mgnify:CR=1 FL=1|jgi:hypothetical protein
MYNDPFPFTLIIDDKDSGTGLSVRGFERVQIIPASIYYNDRLFVGYSLLNIN